MPITKVVFSHQLHYLMVHCLFGYIFLMQSVAALYEDQAGKFDWRKQLLSYPVILKVQHHRRSHFPECMFIYSDQNALGRIDVKSGKLVWRLAFEAGSRGVVNYLHISRSGLFSVRSNGTLMQKFDNANGALLREAELQNLPCEMVDIRESSDTVFILACDKLHAFNLDGKQLWTRKLHNQTDIPWQIHIGIDSKSENVLVALGDGESMEIYEIDAINSDDQRLLTKIVAPFLKAELVGHFVIYCSSITGSLHAYDITSGEDTELAKNVEMISEIDAFSPNCFCIRTVSAVRCFYESFSGKFIERVVRVVNNSFISGVQQLVPMMLAVWTVADDNISVDIYDESGAHRGSVKIPIDSSILIADVVQVQLLKADEKGSHFLIVILTEDHTMFMMKESGEVIWTRYEALAKIASAEIVDLPLSETETLIEQEFLNFNGKYMEVSLEFLTVIDEFLGNILYNFVKRIFNEVFQLQTYIVHLFSDVFGLADIFGLNLLRNRTKNRLERDQFGLHKMIVASASSGTIFGIDSSHGDVLWKLYIRDAVPFTHSQVWFPIFIQRTTAFYPYPAQCAVVMKHKHSGNALIVTFNPITGDVFDKVYLNFTVDQASLLPFKDDKHASVLLLMDKENDHAYIFSNSPLDKSVLLKKPISVVKLDRKTGVCNGFQLTTLGGQYNQIHGLQQWNVQKTWTLNFLPDSDSEIVDFQIKSLDAKVHSQGRVLGNRSVLYKYLNPNLGVSLTRTVDDRAKDDITVTIFDAVAGNVIYIAKQKRSLGPYRLLLCENWIIYTFWNEKYRRMEISVVEMYEGESQSDPLSFSSYRQLQPIVYHQTYIFPQGLSAVAVSETEKAITPRFILLAMPFGGVVEIPKAFLDPRRTVNITPELKEEGVIPYAPDLPIATDHIINYNQTLINVRGIHTAPSGMESTSLVFIYGLDLFFTRINPAGTFDILKEDFDHWLITVVLLGLTCAAVFSRKLAKNKELKQSWC
ncbi:ER membrane protein complex subunit 1 [Trichinella pseudospiralis]|uniref:ER membrane protein complex subunit 1 n=2 Tax=Trichinella pseudospiralis TaxID=6337 RepID=A0A0V1EHP9_TRIPS|nr:ER membrane protein complex subunit 1 [Trichinella pseudospiralis]